MLSDPQLTMSLSKNKCGSVRNVPRIKNRLNIWTTSYLTKHFSSLVFVKHSHNNTGIFLLLKIKLAKHVKIHHVENEFHAIGKYKTLSLNTYLEIFNLQLRIIIEQFRGYQLEVIFN